MKNLDYQQWYQNEQGWNCETIEHMQKTEKRAQVKARVHATRPLQWLLEKTIKSIQTLLTILERANTNLRTATK